MFMPGSHVSFAIAASGAGASMPASIEIVVASLGAAGVGVITTLSGSGLFVAFGPHAAENVKTMLNVCELPTAIL
jgi:hypothetical protein